ncbi:MAG: 1,4-alpha-glucan branching protein GlgB [Nitrospiraceae bacterium]|nr:1,4-alpha-glucan branching protein GlgB [Nitrospiraceae bacterium]MDA8262458.1 1,4-alpha-glucan branching protein GlgB [Actinomycetota bacterium]
MASEVRFVSEFDLYLLGTGGHRRPWEALGSHWGHHEGSNGTHFATWAPQARSVAVIGDMNGWVPEEAYHLHALGDSGVWEGFIPGAGPGQRYKFRIMSPDGAVHEKADPYATQSAEPPSAGSVISGPSGHVFGDSAWMEARGGWLGDRPVSIYEVHLGSLRRDPWHPDEPLSYARLADFLVDYVGELGFTHVELMPITEHPFYGSWGYQTTSYYAPTTRYGLPDELRAFVDRLHQAGIGVICDWAPAHFPRDPYALANFDGSPLYEKSDPRMATHSDWGTLVFDYSRPQVRNFLVGSALYLIEQFHFDALRVDAVASMLYLDYSRPDFVPNAYGGREDLDAIAFLKEMNEAVHQLGATTIAEESTAFPKVARPTYEGGLGFGFKWNMGWMHDTLAYLSRDSAHRSWHHDEITFGLHYAFSENFVLPLSHDECVHGKGSIYTKMAGDDWTKLASVRALYGWMWAHPGKKLLFMGDEFAQPAEWSHDRSLDWHLLEESSHNGVRRLVADLNRLYRSYPELHAADLDPRGFGWIRATDRDRNLFVTVRRTPGEDSGMIVCVANFSGSEWRDIPIGVPKAGGWTEILNTDSRHYGGSGVGNLGSKVSEPQECDGYPDRLVISIAADSVIWFYAED